ncbi:MAG TPA: GTP 3',8-cyclase MoaA [Acidimicrobiales bacterium]|nr:GTP 3',8-cyclase MoaA [Acidimicrobiales bacterium]
MNTAAVPVALGRSGPGFRRARHMPTRGPLVDGYGRVHTDLRISVTDRCNLRCVYCMPEEGVPVLPRSELLTFEEIERVAAVARGLGIDSVRITGGEPLVRRGIVDLVRRLARIGFGDMALTTNGTSLPPLARALSEAGLRRVNISCDSLRPERFGTIRRRGRLENVLEAMASAEEAGLGPVKVNVVLMAGWNDDEVADFAAFARDTGRIVRFIEFMPLDAQGSWSNDLVVPGEEVLEKVNALWPVEPVAHCEDPAAPVERFRFTDGKGEIGIIRSVTQPFCSACDRLRLTADGAVRNCLFSDAELSVRDVLRSGGDDADVERMLRRSVWAKAPGHGINEPGFLRPARSMSMIGG